MADFWESLIAPFTGKPIEQAAAAKEAALREGYGIQSQQYGAGRGALTDQYTAALQPYAGMMPTAMSGYEAYANASGARGRPGQEEAQRNFLNDPGYLFAQRQMEDAVQRAGVAGGVPIGNRVADIMDRTQGLAARSYGDYVNRLAPWLGQTMGIAGGQAGINMGLGGELNRSFTGQGDAAMRAMAGIGGAQAEGALAPMAAGSNIWNLGLNLEKMAMGMPSFGGGGIGGAAPGGYGNPGYYGGSPENNPLLRPV